MPPCRKICTGRWMPLPLPGPACQALPSCPAPPSCVAPPSCAPPPSCAAPPACAPPPSCAPPPQLFTLACSCDEPELTCDEDTCANAADCKQLQPSICPHGLATDDDSEPPLNPQLIHLICPHCQSQIALFDDLKKPQPAKSYPIVPINQSQSRHSCPAQRKSINTRTASTETTNIGEYSLPTCPSKKSIEMKPQSCHSPVPPCCGSDSNEHLLVEQPERRSPHISQIKVATSDDLNCPNPPPEPVAKSCCKSANAMQSAADEIRTRPTCCSDAPSVSKTQMRTGAATCPMCQPPPMPCKVCMQAMAAAPPPKCCPISTAGQADQGSQKQTHRGSQPIQKSQNEAQSARGSASKGKDKQKPPPPGPNPDCPRSGASPLFPAKPAPQACLCRMPPAYTTTGCTGNLSGNCNCTASNK